MPEHNNAEEAPQVTQTVEEIREIVTFDSDEAVVCENMPYETGIPRMPSIQHTDASYHSVVSYLQRPQLLDTFRWPAGAARSENLFKPGNPRREDGLLVPTGLFSNRVMISRKLDGFTSFKATCVLKLQVNAQPFQCGRLLMAAAPMPQLLGNRKQFIFSHVSQAQNLHHVQMDIAKDTEVELRIPFISPYNCFDLVDGKFDWAEVRILVYSPLNVKGDGGCLQCLVYGHFEDIEMGAPTSGSVKQQSLMPNLKQVDETKADEATGKFTGALAQLGSSLVNKGIGLLSPISRPVDGIISAMGWSKPILAKPSRIFLNRPTEGFQYMDGVDHSLMLGITASNSVEPIKGLVGTNVDETSFNTLKRIPQMIGAFSYSDQILTCSSTNRTPVELWQCAVAPTCNVPACYYVRPVADSSKNIRDPYSLKWKQPTTLNYITSPFLYWTGSLVYTFKFVKTNYHSGRVEISYHPFVNKVDTERMDFVYRTVVDLRNNSEISVTIPYIAAQPYKRVSTFLDPVNPNPPSPGRLKDIVVGMLYVRALTPLICATEIISNKIEVLVEMRAGDDYQVAAPITSKFMPFSVQNPVQQSGYKNMPDLTPLPSSWGSYHQFEKKQDPNDKRLRHPTKEDKCKNIVLVAKRNPRQQSTNPKEQSGDLILSANNYVPSLSGNPLVGNIQINLDQDYKDKVLQVETKMMRNGTDFVPGSIIRISCDALNYSSILYYPYTHFAGVQTSVIKTKFDYIPKSLTFKCEALKGDYNVTVGINLYLFEKEILSCAIEEGRTLNVKIDTSQLPLPVKNEGSTTFTEVTINPDQLPLWMSEYNIAPLNPRQPPDNPRQQAGQLAMAGVTETRTRAIEGWIPPCITGNSRDAHRPDLSSLCIGEKFNSFRQYAKRFAFCLTSGLDSSKMYHIQPVELIRPGALYLRPTADSSGNNERTQLCLYAPNSKAELSGSPLAFVAGMYAFYRGSVRVKTWLDPRENPPKLVSGHLEYSRQTVDSNIIDDTIENFMTPIAYETPDNKQLPEFQVPYYSPTIVSSTWSHGIDNQFDTPLANLVLSVPDVREMAQVYPIKVAVAAGDDMDFHQFIGPPPVVNLGDITIANRPIHYPVTGFTPTQKIALNPNEANRRTELPASSYEPITYSNIVVQPNVTGGSCPDAPVQSSIPTPVVVRARRSVEQPMEGTDTVDKNLSRLEPCPCMATDLSHYALD